MDRNWWPWLVNITAYETAKKKTELAKKRYLQNTTGMSWHKIAWKVTQNLDEEINPEPYSVLGWGHYTWNEKILQKPAVEDLKLRKEKQNIHRMHGEQRTKFLYGNSWRESHFQRLFITLNMKKFYDTI